ncbi:MAG: flagellar export protein FliJ [Hyphomicrobiaceae bacterium]
MKSRETVVQLRKFDVEEKQRKVADLEIMIAEFGRMAQDLDQQIAAEEARVGVNDPSHFSYPPFAKAAAQRRDNLSTSVLDLTAKLHAAQDELEQARDVLRKAEQRESRRQDNSSAGTSAEIEVAAASRGY